MLFGAFFFINLTISLLTHDQGVDDDVGIDVVRLPPQVCQLNTHVEHRSSWNTEYDYQLYGIGIGKGICMSFCILTLSFELYLLCHCEADPLTLFLDFFVDDNLLFVFTDLILRS